MVVAAVARAYTAVRDDEVTPAAIRGRSRTAAVAQARHLCAYILAQDYHLTNEATGQALDRDHTTILNSRARITALLPRDADLRRILRRVRADLAGRRPDERSGARDDAGRRDGTPTASPQEWDEYRYWRRQARRQQTRGGV